MHTLVVTNPFDGYGVGQHIEDPAIIREILAGEHAHHVVRFGPHKLQSQPEPQSDPEPVPAPAKKSK